jgi:hypothetical protein
MALAQGNAIEGARPGLGARLRDYLDGTYGALLVERAQRRPELWGFVLMTVLGIAVFLVTADPDPQALDYFSRLADAFLHGRYWLDEAPSWLNELIPAGDGRWYVPYPPMPAVLALPFVAVFGREFPAQVYSSLYAGLATGLVYLVLGRLGIGLRIRDRLALTTVFAFGTCFWFVAISGSAWYFAHVSAVLLFAASTWFALAKRPAWLAGLFLGLAALARLPVGLALPFVLAAQLGFPGLATLRTMNRGVLLRTIVIFGLGLAVPAAIYVGFNLVRWGTLTDQAYVLIPGVLQDPIYEKHGILSVWYIPRNVFAILFRSWNYVDDAPWLQPSWWGLGIFLTTPLYLWLFKARLRTPMVAWALLAVALVSIPILTHGNVGITQFGYRFSLDFQLLLFVILATVVARGWTRLMTAAAVASIVICAYAVWAISIDFVAF